MPTRMSRKKPRQSLNSSSKQAPTVPDNVAQFPGTARNSSKSTRKNQHLSPQPRYSPDDEHRFRAIDAIADHVLAARYLAAEGHDNELNRLLDLTLTHIGRTIAAKDGADPHGIATH